MAAIPLLRSFDLASRIPPANLEYFKLGALRVESVTLEADRELEKALADDPLLSQQLHDAATEHVTAAARVVNDAIAQQYERVAEALASDDSYQNVLRKVEDIRRTLNIAIRNAADALSAGTQQAAQRALDEHARRKKLARAQRAKLAFKLSFDALAISASLTALALSAGTNVAAYVGLANTASKAALELRSAFQSADQAAAALDAMLAELRRDIDDQLRRAGTEALKDLSVALVPILSAKLTTLNTAEAKAKELGAKLQAGEQNCRHLAATAVKGVEAVKKLEASLANRPKSKERAARIAAKNEELLQKVEALQPVLRRNWEFQRASLEQLSDWKQKRHRAVRASDRATQLGALSAELHDLATAVAELASAL
jgi:hypothetical protein